MQRVKQLVHKGRNGVRQLGWRRGGVVLAAVGLMGYGGYGLLQWYQTTHAPVPPQVLSATPIARSTDAPSETKPDPNANYTVPADVPRRILLPSIQAEGFVQRVDVDQHAAVAVPNNVHMAGWYVNSVRPGQDGMSIIDGHVSGKYTEGIFKRLGQLKQGDSFTVEFGDKSTKQFQVVSTTSVSVPDATKELFTADKTIKQQLKLITCGGKFDAKTQQFDKRIIVSAKLVAP